MSGPNGLPPHWREVLGRSNRPGTLRYQLRSPKRFREGGVVTARGRAKFATTTLRGVEGVKLVSGKLKPGDREAAEHGPDAMVPQALIFEKRHWTFRAALGWAETHFTRRTNPPPTRYSVTGHSAVGIRIPSAYSSKASVRWSDGSVSRLKIGQVIDLVGTERMQQALDHPGKWIVLGQLRENPAERAAAWVTYSPLAFGIGGGPKFRLEHTDPALPAEQYVSILEANRYATRAGEPAGDHAMRFPWARTGPHFPLKENPPAGETEHRTAEERAQLGALEAIEQLVARQRELSAAIVQLREKTDRGTMPEPWELNRLTGAREAVDTATAAVRRAVAVHGAVIEEFHVSPEPARRRNPPRDAKRAATLFREFHGVDPKHFKERTIPDFDKLVHLGHALMIDYQPAVPRGPKDPAYRHRFGAGAELLASPDGKGLVILGPFHISRRPRGRLGYIRG